MKRLSGAADSRGWEKPVWRGFPDMAAWRRRFGGNRPPANVFPGENKLQKLLFHLTSLLTTRFPQGGSWLLNTVIPPILGHPVLVNEIFKKNLKIIRGVKKFEKILVISDIHIGDAVMMQGAVQGFRDFFPDARIDFVIKKSVTGLIEGNPAVTNVYPRFTGVVFPNAGDIESVQKLVEENGYDLCFNCSSFFEDKSLFPKTQAVLNFMTVAPQLLRNEVDQTGINHFLNQSYQFVEKLLQGAGLSEPAKSFRGVRVTLSDGAVGQARAFLHEKKIPQDKPIVFVNPDTASPFTLIPFEYQAPLLKELLGMDCSILLGASFTHPTMGSKLLESLPPEERERVFLSPADLPLEAYAALIDFADVFISGDTGPLHIAAARKVSRSGQFPFRNRTFVLSVFGATPSRMSGYDSADPLYPPAHQDAPSKTYVSQSPCRNITCVNKMMKTCVNPRCFEGLDVAGMVKDIRLYLRNLAAESRRFT